MVWNGTWARKDDVKWGHKYTKFRILWNRWEPLPHWLWTHLPHRDTYSAPFLPLCSCMTVLPNTTPRSFSSVLMTAESTQCVPVVPWHWLLYRKQTTGSTRAQFLHRCTSVELLCQEHHQWQRLVRPHWVNPKFCSTEALHPAEAYDVWTEPQNPDQLLPLDHREHPDSVPHCVVWHGSCPTQISKTLQRLVKTAELITGNKLTAIGDIYCHGAWVFKVNKPNKEPFLPVGYQAPKQPANRFSASQRSPSDLTHLPLGHNFSAILCVTVGLDLPPGTHLKGS